MQDATEMGKIIREYIAKNNLSQGKLAKELEETESTLSNYIRGETTPNMIFLAKCIKKFKFNNEQMAEFFRLAFISSADSKHHEIKLDTNFLTQERIEMLSKIISVFLLYPEYEFNKPNNENIKKLGYKIDEFYGMLKSNAVFRNPV